MFLIPERLILIHFSNSMSDCYGLFVFISSVFGEIDFCTTISCDFLAFALSIQMSNDEILKMIKHRIMILAAIHLVQQDENVNQQVGHDNFSHESCPKSTCVSCLQLFINSLV